MLSNGVKLQTHIIFKGDKNSPKVERLLIKNPFLSQKQLYFLLLRMYGYKRKYDWLFIKSKVSKRKNYWFYNICLI